MDGTLREKFCVLAAYCLWLSCSSGGEQPAPQAQQIKASPAPVEAVPQAAPEPAPGPEEANPRAVGWDKLRLVDQVPLCVFGGHAQRDKATFLKDVRKQTLAADGRIVFGAFPEGCIAEECDAVPTLECWVDPGEEPNTLIVHTRMSYEHKQGAVCDKDCRPITAGCETPELTPGKYRVKYGAREFALRIPSVVNKPCFELK